METTEKTTLEIINAIRADQEQPPKEMPRELEQQYRIISAADAKSGDKCYTEIECYRAVRGAMREVITAATNNIKDTEDLIAFLADVSEVSYCRVDLLMKNEQTRISRGLF